MTYLQNIRHSKFFLFLTVFIVFFVVVIVLNHTLFPLLLEDNAHVHKTVSPPAGQGEQLIYYISVILFAPIIEEFLYRWGLKFSVVKATFLLLGISYTIAILVAPKDTDYKDAQRLLIEICSFIILFFTFYFLVKKNKSKIENAYREKFRWIFWISVVAFTYSHFSMYENNSLLSIIWSPLTLYTYLISGVAFALIRLRISFIWGCIAHILWNLVMITIRDYDLLFKM